MRFYDNKLNKIESNYVPKNIPWEFLYKTFEKEQAGIDKVKVEAEAAKALINVNPGEAFDTDYVNSVVSPYKQQAEELKNSISAGDMSAAESSAKIANFVTKYNNDPLIRDFKIAEQQYAKFLAGDPDKKIKSFGNTYNQGVFDKKLNANSTQADRLRAYDLIEMPDANKAFLEFSAHIKPKVVGSDGSTLYEMKELIPGMGLSMVAKDNSTQTAKLIREQVYNQLYTAGKALALNPTANQYYNVRKLQMERNGKTYTPEMFAKEGADLFTGEINNIETKNSERVLSTPGAGEQSILADTPDLERQDSYTVDGAVYPGTTDVNKIAGTKRMNLFQNITEAFINNNMLVPSAKESYGAIMGAVNAIRSGKPTEKEVNSPEYKKAENFLLNFAKVVEDGKYQEDVKKYTGEYGDVNIKSPQERHEFLFDMLEIWSNQKFTSYIPNVNLDMLSISDSKIDKQTYKLLKNKEKTISESVKNKSNKYSYVDPSLPGMKPKPLSDTEYNDLAEGVNIESRELGYKNIYDANVANGHMVSSKSSGKEYILIDNAEMQSTSMFEKKMSEFYKAQVLPNPEVPYSNHEFPIYDNNGYIKGTGLVSGTYGKGYDDQGRLVHAFIGKNFKGDKIEVADYNPKNLEFKIGNKVIPNKK